MARVDSPGSDGDIARFQVEGAKVIHKFGRNPVIGTAFVPITIPGIYNMPSALQALEFVSTSANDTAAGTGARKIFVEFADANWNTKRIELATAGLTPVALPESVHRVYRWGIVDSGTYASASVGSHVGTLTLREAAVGPTWDQILLAVAGDYERGRSQIGAFFVPINKTAYVSQIVINIEANKQADLLLMRRQKTDAIVAPFAPAETLIEFSGTEGGDVVKPRTPLTAIKGPADLFFLGRFSVGTGVIDVDMEILLFNGDR